MGIKGCKHFITIDTPIDNDVCLILVWYGPWPEYFPYFLESCKRNPEITWKIFSSNKTVPCSYEHIQHVFLEQADLENMVERKLGYRVSLADPYKICDLKPAFGELFNEFLGSFNFWGYCDMDNLWGRIIKFITQPLQDGLDVLSCYPGFLSGPLTIYRNSPEVNALYRDCPSYDKILLESQCKGFDENILREEITGKRLKKILLCTRFLFERRWRESWEKDYRYHYQWYVKRMTIRDSGPIDMTEAVWRSAYEGKIRAGFFPLLWSEPYFSRIGQKNWQFRLGLEGLIDELTGREIMGFHFQDSKLNPDFRIESGRLSGKTLLIDKNGLRYE